MTPKDIALLIVSESEHVKNPNRISRIYTAQMLVSQEIVKIMDDMLKKERLNYDSKINKK